MADSEEIAQDVLHNEASMNNSNQSGWFEKRIPVAVLVVLCANLFAGIWAASSFYTNQKALSDSFSGHFERVESQIMDLKEEMYTRQEAAIELANIRKVNERQDQAIRELEKDFRTILIESK